MRQLGKNKLQIKNKYHLMDMTLCKHPDGEKCHYLKCTDRNCNLYPRIYLYSAFAYRSIWSAGLMDKTGIYRDIMPQNQGQKSDNNNCQHSKYRHYWNKDGEGSKGKYIEENKGKHTEDNNNSKGENITENKGKDIEDSNNGKGEEIIENKGKDIEDSKKTIKGKTLKFYPTSHQRMPSYSLIILKTSSVNFNHLFRAHTGGSRR